MKEVVVISLITGLYKEWLGTANIEVDEELETLIERIRINQINGTTIMPIKCIDSSIEAINIDYISSIWIKEVE